MSPSLIPSPTKLPPFTKLMMSTATAQFLQIMISGWASQWYPSSFTATITLDGEEESVTFRSAEQWMMVQKALLFSDVPVAREILAVTGTSAGDMATVKALGRKVSDFDDSTWNANRDRIVLEGNTLKFEQNPELKESLLATGDKKLVEASPRDRIWGIGFGEKNALSQKERWGLNLLGIALERTREALRESLDGTS